MCPEDSWSQLPLSKDSRKNRNGRVIKILGLMKDSTSASRYLQ